MIIKNINFKNFRNLEEINIEPCETMNVICGENAQGKTNIIEGIWLFTGAKSFRGSKDNNLLQFKKQRARLSVDFIGDGIEKTARLEIETKRTAVLNEKRLKSAAHLAGNFNAIVFSPNDLQIVSDGPSVRRKFLDIAIGQLYPSYIENLKNYLRAVTQRNKIIKDYKYDSTLSVMLDVFEKEIAENGKKIITARQNYIKSISGYLGKIYEGISREKESLSISYICSSNGEDLEQKLKEKRQEDSFLGATSIGPHRDDIDFKINGVSARLYGPQGQKRSVALCLKLAEAEVIRKNTGEYPVCLLDDVMSELDVDRQNFILNHIKGMQTFLSCCDPQNFKGLKSGKVFTVKDGKIL